MQILIDNDIINECMRIVPAASVFSFSNQPGEISGHMTLSKPLIATISNWMLEETLVDKEIYRNMDKLFGVTT